ncbi:chromosome partitioning protein, ParB family [Alteribacillus persepolensis]|uniref:Chromosome partitioning protein, ParB family n=1 Tax=Alteribacillus persepolensis TaxID=568899 RepID=A0A1G8IYZ6_9BACI|nr:ParB/RepB/Spo0J family partition protein [Alteribacillus persepolensis]SDI24275.1 chromosome partitioning protein, ParB family [Alteribacillus persepolensis]
MGKGLGRGLNAFFPDEAKQEQNQVVRNIKIKDLRPNPYQPRHSFSSEAIHELKESIQEHGILQPLIVRKSIKGYEIVAGERRFRAAKDAGLKTVPAVEQELSDEKMMEIALIENLQRENLNPLEEAKAYSKLIQYLGVTQEELSKRIGKSRPHIANHLRLMQLPKQVQRKLADKTISMGHGRTLLGLDDHKKAAEVLKQVEDESLNVRQTEELVQRINNVSRETDKKRHKKTEESSIFLKSKEDALRSYFGTSVSIKKGKKKGKIEIEFLTDDDLERILQLLDKDS